MTYKFLDLTGLKQTITQIFSKLKAVALSGSYTDLINRPTIVNNGTTTTTNTVLDGRMGKTLADKDANLQSQITSLNSSLDNVAQLSQTFVEDWLDRESRYEVIISFDDIDISKTNRIPVLIGGNINNAPFLYMYNFDLPNLPQNATAVEGTPILQISQTFYVTGNKDGNNSRRLRILFNNQTNSGAHVYIDVKVCGGEVIGTNTYPLS